jgi:hypothetical protein
VDEVIDIDDAGSTIVGKKLADAVASQLYYDLSRRFGSINK